MKNFKDTIMNRTRNLQAVSSLGYSPFLGNKLLLLLLLFVVVVVTYGFKMQCARMYLDIQGDLKVSVHLMIVL